MCLKCISKLALSKVEVCKARALDYTQETVFQNTYKPPVDKVHIYAK